MKTCDLSMKSWRSEGRSPAWMANSCLLDFAMFFRRPGRFRASELVQRKPTDSHHFASGIATLQFNHEKIIGIADVCGRGGRGRVRYEAIIPKSARL